MITIYVVEMRFAKKESSRMKQAGASKGFYIQSKVEYRGIAFETIGYLINGRVVVY